MKIRVLLMGIGLAWGVTGFAFSARPYVGIEWGSDLITLGNSSPAISYHNNYLTDTYPLDNVHLSTTSLSLHGGFVLPQSRPDWMILLGLGWYKSLGATTANGIVNETASGGSTKALYNYSFSVCTQRLMLESQVQWQLTPHWAPYAEAGLGAAWNSASNYQEVATEGFVTSSAFSNLTTNNLAYQAGLGLRYAFQLTQNQKNNLDDHVSVGYRYVNTGNVSFGDRGSSYPYSLNLGSLTLGEWYISIMHIL
jgi:opacity protein-like surface antigen